MMEPGSTASSERRFVEDSVFMVERSFGLNVGRWAAASTSPVVGSTRMAHAAWGFTRSHIASSSSSTIACRGSRMVRKML